MKARLSREVAAILPWLGALILWFGVVSPLREEPGARLAEQSSVRRDRLRAERVLRDNEALRARVATALAPACRASGEAALLRQRAVAAASGLGLSPFSLSVTGGPGGGASVDATGSRQAVLEMAARLGDPALGGFLRTVSVRHVASGFVVSLTTGVLDAFPPGVLPVRPPCAIAVGPSPEPESFKPPDISPSRAPRAATPRIVPRESGMAAIELAPTPTPAPTLPFTLVGFLVSDGRSRLSVRLGGEIRVVGVGDSVAGWRCTSIDRDERAVFVSASGDQLILKASQ